MTNKLKGKDLITIGIFTAVYFVMAALCNALCGITAIGWFLSSAVAGLLCATPFLILASKVKKSFALLILTVIVGLVFSLTYHIAVTITFIVAGIIAEIIRYATKYNSFWGNVICYMLVSLGMAASPLPLWLDTDAFIKQITDFGVSQSYIDTCQSLTSPFMFVLIIVATLVFAFLGSLISRALFKKHFIKAGIVG